MLQLLELVPYITIFIFGITIGSFLNVCIYRLPLGESVVTAPSHCMSCGEKLHWYDMVPVFSWIILGGKCRNCKARISVQYPIIEGVNGILYVIICAVNGWNLMSGVYCLMASALVVLAVIDWRTYEIPFGINVFLLIVGMVMDTTPAILILTPILLPIVTAVGMNPIHFGIMMVVNLAIGFVTPPIGVNLFVASSLTDIPIMRISKHAMPMIGYFLVALLLITFIPAISLALI